MDIETGVPIVESDDKAERAAAQGYVTSAGYSPTLGAPLALGFLRDGRARQGQVVKMVGHLRGAEVLCTVTDSVRVDPEGGRLRG